MRRDFEIKGGISLAQPPYELDLHNDYDFHLLQYSVTERKASLHWRRSTREVLASTLPASLTIEFRGVSEFRFQPRDPAFPFTEDDCVSTFGYWKDEPWARNVFFADPPQTPGPSYLTGIAFQSGAVVAIQADSAHALIES